MAEFEPRELDELEDALELLSDPFGAEDEDLDARLAELELSPALDERMHEYADVLALCREAFPLEEPGDDLLADVLAEARAVASTSTKHHEGVGAGGSASGWQRFWERWRGTLVPGFALAGTAALVLWMLEPETTETLALVESPSADEKKDEPRPSEAPTDAAMPTRADGGAERADAGGDEAKAEDEGEQGDGEEVAGDDLTPGASKPKSKKTKAVEQVVEPTPEPEPLTKNESWDLIDAADKARKAGRCVEATADYETVIGRTREDAARGRAHAGVGLCRLQQGQHTDAEAWFDQARAESPAVGPWLDGQLDEQPVPTKKKPSKKKKTKSDYSGKKKAPLGPLDSKY